MTGFDLPERVPEPPLASLFRILRDQKPKPVVTVCSVDGSAVAGRVAAVDPDGVTVILSNGENDYVFVTELVSVVKMPKPDPVESV